MTLRSVPVESDKSDALESDDAAPAVDLLREESADDELNAWAQDAADRVLARFRKAHGLARPAEHSGFFTTKSG